MKVKESRNIRNNIMKTSARKRGYTSPLTYMYINIYILPFLQKIPDLKELITLPYHTLVQKKSQKINCQQKCIHKFIHTHLYAATEIQPISTPKKICPCTTGPPASALASGQGLILGSPQELRDFCCRSQKKHHGFHGDF